MKTNDSILKIISNEAIGAGSSMKIVTPSIYASIFEERAKIYNFEVEDEVNLSHEIIKDECSNLFQMRENNHQNNLKLSDTASKAIMAIKQKDETILNEVLEETEELRREIEALKETVYKDELTNVHNRKWMNDNYLDGEKFTINGIIAMIDLNYFKEVNDTFGHTIGDKVLIYIANNLKKTRFDVVRYGGDEFLVIFKNRDDLNKTLSIITNIRKDVISKKLKSKNGEFKVSFSVGMSTFKIGDNFSEILELADSNMYKDKVEIKKIVTGIH